MFKVTFKQKPKKDLQQVDNQFQNAGVSNASSPGVLTNQISDFIKPQQTQATAQQPATVAPAPAPSIQAPTPSLSQQSMPNSGQAQTPQTPPPKRAKDLRARRKLPVRTKVIILAIVMTLLGIIAVFIAGRFAQNQATETSSTRFNNIKIPLSDLAASETITVNGARSLQVNGQLKVSDTIVIAPTARPNNAIIGQLYYDKGSNQLAYYNGSDFVNLIGSSTQVQGSGAAVTNIISGGGTGTVTTLGGTTNRIPKFSGSQTLSDSIISDNGDNASVNGNFNLINSTPGGADVSGWNMAATPVTASTSDIASVEVGVKFQTDVSGFVKSVRFYKGSLNTGTHTGSLWTSNGTQIATGTFTNETATGWQELTFANPVPVVADTTYTASYHAPNGGYAADAFYFQNTGIDKGPLHILQDGVDGGNGVFKYGVTSVFPNQNFKASNYWVDILFSPNPSPGRYQINGVQIATTDLADKSNIAKRSTSQLFSGLNTFRTASDSASAFSIQKSDTTPLLSANTINMVVTMTNIEALEDIYLDRHIISGSRNGAPIITTGTAACTTPTTAISGNDIAGLVTVTTGTGCAGVGKILTLTYRNAFSGLSMPRVLLTPANAAAAGLSTYVDSATVSLTAADVQVSAGTIADTTQYKWYYLIMQ